MGTHIYCWRHCVHSISFNPEMVFLEQLMKILPYQRKVSRVVRILCSWQHLQPSKWRGEKRRGKQGVKLLVSSLTNFVGSEQLPLSLPHVFINTDDSLTRRLLIVGTIQKFENLRVIGKWHVWTLTSHLVAVLLKIALDNIQVRWSCLSHCFITFHTS